jgi:hypothetical protein
MIIEWNPAIIVICYYSQDNHAHISAHALV